MNDMIDFENMDFSNVEYEISDVVEYELSEDVSVLYDKSTKKFTIEGIDQETYDEYTIDIEEPFEGLQIDKDTYLSKEDFEEFKNVVSQNQCKLKKT